MGHATLLVPEGVSFKVLIEVRAVMRVEMLILQKSDFDWLLTFYPDPMERLRDELTDWSQLLQWISLPKVYTKRIRRIVESMGGSPGEKGSLAKLATRAARATRAGELAHPSSADPAAPAGSDERIAGGGGENEPPACGGVGETETGSPDKRGVG